MTRYARRGKLQNSGIVRLVSLALGASWVVLVTLFVVASLSGCTGRGFDCYGEAGVACRSDAGRDSAVDAYRHDAAGHDVRPNVLPRDASFDLGDLRDAAMDGVYPHDTGVDVQQPPEWQVLFTLRTTSTDPDTFFGQVFRSGGQELRWDFGDGTIVDGDSAIHKYSLAGEKEVRLLSKDGALRIIILKLGSNGLVGDVVAELEKLTDLRILDLSQNELTGVSTQLGKLTKLGTLNLGDTGLTGNIPPEIRQLKELETLDLADNPFTGYSPGTFSGLTVLCTLDLRQNHLDQTALDAIIDDFYQDRESNVCPWARTLDLRGASSVPPSAAAIDKVTELRESYFWRIHCDGC